MSVLHILLGIIIGMGALVLLASICYIKVDLLQEEEIEK